VALLLWSEKAAFFVPEKENGGELSKKRKLLF